MCQESLSVAQLAEPATSSNEISVSTVNLDTDRPCPHTPLRRSVWKLLSLNAVP